MKYVIKHPPRTQSISFWARELGKDMRVLFKRGALALTSETGGFRRILTAWDKLTSCPVLPAGHDRDVRCLVISPDSKWIATGSNDSTIIVWDAGDGSIAQQWVAHNYAAVRSLAFSPDTRYLVSCGEDRKLAVWNPSDPIREVAVLQPAVLHLPYPFYENSCAWSPDGSVITETSCEGAMTF